MAIDTKVLEHPGLQILFVRSDGVFFWQRSTVKISPESLNRNQLLATVVGHHVADSIGSRRHGEVHPRGADISMSDKLISDDQENLIAHLKADVQQAFNNVSSGDQFWCRSYVRAVFSYLEAHSFVIRS